ncbi:MAG: 4-alpha-glucanotransferase, partial [Gaiellaceae bacterium]
VPAAEPHWGLAEMAYASRARLAILSAQDMLGLGSEARMNRPGEEYGNWTWRLEPGELTREHALRLRALAERFDR